MDSISLDCKTQDLFSADEKLLETRWLFNSSRLLNLSKNVLTNYSQSLQINKIELEESGRYECNTETNTTIYKTIYDLSVTANRKKTIESDTGAKLESRNMMVRVSKDKPVVFDCTWWFNQTNLLFSNMDNENIETEWRLNGSLIQNQISQGKYEYLDAFNTLLKINDIKSEQKDDIYTCTLRYKQSPLDVKQSNFTLFIGGNKNCLFTEIILF